MFLPVGLCMWSRKCLWSFKHPSDGDRNNKFTREKSELKEFQKHFSANHFLGRKQDQALNCPRSKKYKQERQGCVENDLLMSTIFLVFPTISTNSFHISEPEQFSQVPPGRINLSQKHFPSLSSHFTSTDFKLLEAKTKPQPSPISLGKVPD